MSSRTSRALAAATRTASATPEPYVALPEMECERLNLPPMCPHRNRTDGFRFTVTVDAADGISTGISARDRAHTIRRLADRSTTPGDLSRPGHILPVRVSDGGVARAHGFPEAAIDLVSMSGLSFSDSAVRPAPA